MNIITKILGSSKIYKKKNKNWPVISQNCEDSSCILHSSISLLAVSDSVEST